jgi:hypothetical protein
MATDLEKEQMLRSAGFLYDFNRMAYINRQTKKVISVEALQDHPEEWLRDMIAQANDSGDWRFYFNEPPSPRMKEAFLAGIR